MADHFEASPFSVSTGTSLTLPSSRSTEGHPLRLPSCSEGNPPSALSSPAVVPQLPLSSLSKQSKRLHPTGICISSTLLLLGLIITSAMTLIAFRLYLPAFVVSPPFTWLSFVIFTYYGYTSVKFDWLGFGQFKRPDNDYRRHRTLWNCLILVIIPIVRTVGTIGLITQQSSNSMTLSTDQYHLAATQYLNNQSFAATRFARNQQLAQDQHIEMNLQSFLDRMSEILLHPNLHACGQLGDNVRILATARTIIILQDLDATHRADNLKFLVNASLNTSQAPQHSEIVNPVANLNGANLSDANLSSTDLIVADMSKASFNNANLGRNDPTRAAQIHMKNTPLLGADLRNTNPTNADLIGTTLIDTVLTHVFWHNTACPNGRNTDKNQPKLALVHNVKGGNV